MTILKLIEDTAKSYDISAERAVSTSEAASCRTTASLLRGILKEIKKEVKTYDIVLTKFDAGELDLEVLCKGNQSSWESGKHLLEVTC